MIARTLFSCLVVLAPIVACRALEPTNKAIDGCTKRCEQRAGRNCSGSECERGCEMIIDRIMERESHHVIACVARQTRRCADVVWAECAAHVGVHADGGPPGPPPPSDDWE